MTEFQNRDEALRWVRAWAQNPPESTDARELMRMARDNMTWNGELPVDLNDARRLAEAEALLLGGGAA